LRAANIATVVASGNSSFIDGIGMPACISSAISVGSTTKDDVVSEFSNGASFLSLLAPGSAILSSTPDNGLGLKYGTSMAAPHVAGAFALLRQAQPAATVSDILAVLQNTGVPITDWRNGIPTPRIDVQAAVDTLDTTGSNAPAMTSPVPGTALPGETVTFQWTGNGVAVDQWWLYIGSAQGEADLYNSGALGTQQSVTSNGLPSDGRAIFVRLWYHTEAAWQFVDVQYTAYPQGERVQFEELLLSRPVWFEDLGFGSALSYVFRKDSVTGALLGTRIFYTPAFPFGSLITGFAWGINGNQLTLLFASTVVNIQIDQYDAASDILSIRGSVDNKWVGCNANLIPAVISHTVVQGLCQ
jgi:hypothetical protein